MFKRTISAAIVAVALAALAAPAVLLAHEGREVGEYQLTVGFLHEPAFEGQANAATIRVMGPGEDHDAHGELFASGTVEPGGSFEYTFDHDLEDETILFHDHLTGSGGSVTVSHDGELSGTVMVMFDGEFSPSELHVQADTTVMFMNVSTDQVMTVLSGAHDAAATDHGHAATVPVLDLASSIQVEVTHIPTGTSRVMAVRRVFGDDGLYAADFVPTAPGAYTFRFFGEINGEAFDEEFTAGPETFDEVESARNVQFPIELRETRELQGAVEGIQSDLEVTNDTATGADSTASTALVIGIVGLVVGVLGLGAGGYGLMLSRRKA